MSIPSVSHERSASITRANSLDISTSRAIEWSHAASSTNGALTKLGKLPLSFVLALGFLSASHQRTAFAHLLAIDTLINSLTYIWQKARWSMRPWESAPGVFLFLGRADSQGRMDQNCILTGENEGMVNPVDLAREREGGMMFGQLTLAWR